MRKSRKQVIAEKPMCEHAYQAAVEIAVKAMSKKQSKA